MNASDAADAGALRARPHADRRCITRRHVERDCTVPRRADLKNYSTPGTVICLASKSASSGAILDARRTTIHRVSEGRYRWARRTAVHRLAREGDHIYGHDLPAPAAAVQPRGTALTDGSSTVQSRADLGRDHRSVWPLHDDARVQEPEHGNPSAPTMVHEATAATAARTSSTPSPVAGTTRARSSVGKLDRVPGLSKGGLYAGCRRRARRGLGLMTLFPPRPNHSPIAPTSSSICPWPST